MGDPAGRGQYSSTSNPNFTQASGGEEYEDGLGGQPHGSALHSGMPPSSQAYYQQRASRPEAFNMTSMSTALPEMNYAGYGQIPQQGYAQNQSSRAMVYPLQHVPAYMGQAAISPTSMTAPYNMQYPMQQGVFGSARGTDAQQMLAYQHAQNYLAQQQQNAGGQAGSQYYEQRNQVGQGHAYGMGQTQGQFGRQGVENRLGLQQGANIGNTGAGSTSRSATKSSVVRGPPRKPRQSGHAIWIGNLPPQTDLMSLVYHVCKEATGLESLFLISKSNCAFANFKDEAACAAAQAKIHDSRFQTVRLVSRLRRSSGAAGGVSAPTGPAALVPQAPPAQSLEDTSKPGLARLATDVLVDGDSTSRDKYFIVKSLTVEDLELSVRNGIWATQAHNEETLNKAFEAASNVYLIFSANKSGEYFGYARMTSPINNDPAAAIEFAPSAQAVEDPELPKATPTPANDYAPRGRIIDDSARGTIFWEAERDEFDETEEEDDVGSNKSDPDADAPPSKAWGKPFKLEWISVTKLPFYRTRGLRNPWNSNREVKIARDGTELETSVGRRLIALFHRSPSPVSSAMPQMQGMPPPSMGGYGQMRPF